MADATWKKLAYEDDVLLIANLENTPTEDLETKAPTSLWAFDTGVAVGLNTAKATCDATNVAAALALGEQEVLGRLTGGSQDGLSPTQMFYNIIMSVATAQFTLAGGAATLNMATAWNHYGTVDAAATLSITDPGCTGWPWLSIRMTKDATATARALTLQKTGGGGTFLWGSNDTLESLTENGGVYYVFLKRIAADTYDCFYQTMGF